jgi:histone deacetylase 1/2
MITRSKNNIHKPKILSDHHIRYPIPKALMTTLQPQNKEPTCYSTAVKHHHWREAMNKEFDALLVNGTWTLVPKPPNANLVGCKWVYKVKRKADGNIEHFKAHLVAKGFHQQKGVDFGETFSPVVKPPIVRLVLSLAVSHGWYLRQIDVQNAFLHSLLHKDVFMTQPPGFIHPQLPHQVCKLQRSLYGLRQAPRVWFSRLTDQLQAIGFIGSQADHSLYIYHQGSTLIYLLIYVNDIILAGVDMQSINRVITLLQNKFAVKDIGDLTFFLGIEAIRDASGLHLSQRRYILDLLTRS